ncbi:MAG: hypothetical protein P4L91_10670 [Burkholderiaceae bacterium]|nr:hypothetical protein [Burkholderiaceae bacterium]
MKAWRWRKRRSQAAVASGELLPSESATLAGIAEARRKALETEVLEARIAALEDGEMKSTV